MKMTDLKWKDSGEFSFAKFEYEHAGHVLLGIVWRNLPATGYPTAHAYYFAHKGGVQYVDSPLVIAAVLNEITLHPER